MRRVGRLLAHGHKLFNDEQMTEFFTANGELKANEIPRLQALALCTQATKEASLACMITWETLISVTAWRGVIHGDADASVPFDGSALRTHQAIPGSELRVIADWPHGCNISHSDEFNQALLDFLATRSFQ